MVLAEGSAVVTVESENDARARGVPIYARILGRASVNEGAHLRKVDETGEAVSRSIVGALASADLRPTDIDFICAHGNSMQDYDAAETAGPPPLNELEVAVIDALAELGLTGMRAELPFDNAAIWVRVDERRALTVSALRIDSDRSEFVVVRTRMTGGIEVATGESSPSSGESLRFHCGDLRYYVGGTAPPPFGDLDAFVDAFISVIDCTPSPTVT